MLYILGYLFVFAIWMGIELLLAPKGYEDESGFHYGLPKKVLKEKANINRIKKFSFRKIIYN